MNNLLGSGDKNIVGSGGGSKLLLKPDDHSPEYHQAQQERIEKRRQRIAAKIANELCEFAFKYDKYPMNAHLFIFEMRFPFSGKELTGIQQKHHHP